MNEIKYRPGIGTTTAAPDKPDDGAGCIAVPAEFVRLRYFFGQRLGVIDFADEQSYLVGKQRFHNLRAHGSGVLCGLRAERFVFPQGTAAAGRPTTLLRVRRGAALDAWGREIVVGWDQCIDVAAWFQQNHKRISDLQLKLKPRPKEAVEPEAGKKPAPTVEDEARATHEGDHATEPAVEVEPKVTSTDEVRRDRLWVGLCYRECPSDPAPAPRDPCGCDAGGCEYARVREGFELMLLTDAEARAFIPRRPSLQGIADLHAEEAQNGTAYEALIRAVHRLIGEDCSELPADACLLLASFKIRLDPDGKRVIDISAPDNTIPERLSLAPSAMLQEVLMLVLSGAAEAGLIGDGPRLVKLGFRPTKQDAGLLRIALSGALAHDPFKEKPPGLTVSVSRFDNPGWTRVKTVSKYVDATKSPYIAIDLDPIKAGRYRVLVESNRAEPPVDAAMRPLQPPSFARNFRLVQGEGPKGLLVMADTLSDL